MKFDFVIGNPPYQEEISGENNQSKPVYNLFMDAAYEVSDIVELITPARFLSKAGATPKAWNEKMLDNVNLKILDYIEDSQKVFNGVDIKGGVVITYRDKNREFEPIGVFIKNGILKKIYDKVKDSLKTNIGELVHSPDSYRFTDELFNQNPNLIGRTDKAHSKAVASSVFDRYPEIFNDSESKNDDVAIIGRKNNTRLTLYTKAIYLNDQGNLYKWKVLMAGAIGKGTFGEILSEPIIASPKTAHTQSFLSIGEFESENEAKAVVKYIKTKFFRALLGIMKTTQNNQSKVTWSKIPLHDFTSTSDIDWKKSTAEIDKQLYKKYNLTQEEIDFIENNVKEMD